MSVWPTGLFSFWSLEGKFCFLILSRFLKLLRSLDLWSLSSVDEASSLSSTSFSLCPSTFAVTSASKSCYFPLVRTL